MGREYTVVSAADFKSRCLGIIDEVAATQEGVVITKRGKPLARLLPMEAVACRSLRGSVTVTGDLLAPVEQGGNP